MFRSPSPMSDAVGNASRKAARRDSQRREATRRGRANVTVAELQTRSNQGRRSGSWWNGKTS